MYIYIYTYITRIYVYIHIRVCNCTIMNIHMPGLVVRLGDLVQTFAAGGAAAQRFFVQTSLYHGITCLCICVQIYRYIYIYT